jgi:uncharacterized protein YraI
MATKKRKKEPAAASAASELVVVHDRGLNVRSGPGPEYPVVRVAPAGCKLTSTGEQTPGWIQVEDGWVMALYVARLSAEG